MTCGCGKRPMSTRPYTPGWLISTDTPTSAADAAPASKTADAAHRMRFTWFMVRPPNEMGECARLTAAGGRAATPATAVYGRLQPRARIGDVLHGRGVCAG